MATKKAKAPVVAAVETETTAPETSAAVTTPAATEPAKEVKEPKGPGKIEQIIAMHKAGKTNAEIVEAGFNKTTVSIQVSAYKKDPKGWDQKHTK